MMWAWPFGHGWEVSLCNSAGTDDWEMTSKNNVYKHSYENIIAKIISLPILAEILLVPFNALLIPVSVGI